MRAELRQYKHEKLRRPSTQFDGFVDKRDSFTTVYLTLFPFLAAEYAVELAYDAIPSGLVFPVGYLLFWAFYYTYYKPGFLEDHLSNPHKWDLAGIPALFLGVLIWFMKVTFVELSHLVLLRWFVPRKVPAVATAAANTSRPQPKAKPRYTAPPPPPKREAPKGRPPAMGLDLIVALQTLGLTESVTWNQVHRRYRDLAKQYHPDLNREKTDHGRRFIQIDQAYRKLLAQKNQFR